MKEETKICTAHDNGYYTGWWEDCTCQKIKLYGNSNKKNIWLLPYHEAVG